jgi:hypothetical protein
MNYKHLVIRFDYFLRQQYGVFEFSSNLENILRVQFSRATREVSLSDNVIPKNEEILLIHLWNEHIPKMPVRGADIGWAKKTLEMFVHSLQALATLIDTDPRFTSVRAINGTTVVFTIPDHWGGYRFMQRLGFKVIPYYSRLGKFGEYWENLYGYALIWAYNEGSLKTKRLGRLHRYEVWMSRAAFVERFANGRR